MDSTLELQYALDTFYFLVCGALVMWMAAGFAMLEAGMVRSKNTAEILTKNMALFSISCIMYLVCGYAIMYGGGYFLSGIELDGAASADALTETDWHDRPAIFERSVISFSVSEGLRLPFHSSSSSATSMETCFINRSKKGTTLSLEKTIKFIC